MKEVLKVYVRVFMFLFPVFFLPVAVDPFGFGKNWMILAMALVGMLIWVGQMLTNKDEGIRTNKIWWVLVALVAWGWIGWWRESIGVRMQSLTEIGGVGTMTAMLGWFFLWLQVTDKEEEKKQFTMLTAAGILTAVTSVIVFLIPAAKMPISWPKDNPIISLSAGWSLTGSLLTEGILMIFLALNWGKKILEKMKTAGNNGYITEAITAAVFTLILFLDLFRIFKAGWINIDGTTSWVIAVETFKRSPLWGIGPGNFAQAFNSYRPNSYNATKLWSTVFKHSTNGVLEMWTELGVIGLALSSIIGVKFLGQKKNFAFLTTLLMGLMVVFLPVNLMSMLLLVWLLSTVIFEEKKNVLSLKVGENGFNAAPWLVGVGVTGVTVFGGIWMGRILMADAYMRQSLVAASKNNGGSTYNLQIKSTAMNPYMADYRRIYSQTNMALASTLLSNKDITDDDKQKASVLIQQAVREGKAAIALDSYNPDYWNNLAVIYRQLIGVVDGSADWSFQAYQQAEALDPANPVTKLDLGGLLYAANRVDEADRVFEETVTAKQDFANGWYNWAYSGKKLGKLADAVQRLSQAVTLVSADSGDYDKATKELDTWKKELDEAIKKQNAATAQQQAQTKQAETLKTADPLPTGNPEEKVNVPASDMQPPATNKVDPQVTPQMTPTVTPTAKTITP